MTCSRVSTRIALSVLTLGIFAAALTLPSFVGAQATPAAPAAPLSLDRNMGALNRAYRIVKAGAADKTKDEATLTALAQMQQSSVAAKGQVPSTVEKLTGDQKAKKLAEYRRMMVKLIQAQLTLEDQILAGENDKAAASIKAIDEIQAAGHKEFQPE